MSSLWPSSSSTSCASTNTFVYAGARHVTQSALDLHAVLQADRSFTGGEYTATDPDSPSTILKSTHCICILFSSHLGTDLLAPTSYSLKDSVFALKLMHNYEQESMDHVRSSDAPKTMPVLIITTRRNRRCISSDAFA
ncbi:hypothetical protein PMIN04_004295 [Paraphaeosphaeria minitans]